MLQRVCRRSHGRLNAEGSRAAPTRRPMIRVEPDLGEHDPLPPDTEQGARPRGPVGRYAASPRLINGTDPGFSRHDHRRLPGNGIDRSDTWSAEIVRSGGRTTPAATHRRPLAQTACPSRPNGASSTGRSRPWVTAHRSSTGPARTCVAASVRLISSADGRCQAAPGVSGATPVREPEGVSTVTAPRRGCPVCVTPGT